MTTAMTSVTAGSSQYQPPVVRMIAPVAATPAAAAASAMVSSRTDRSAQCRQQLDEVLIG